MLKKVYKSSVRLTEKEKEMISEIQIKFAERNNGLLLNDSDVLRIALVTMYKFDYENKE